jgi:hypothetical protein
MTGAELDAALSAIGWTRAQLAGAIGHHTRTAVDRWVRDGAELPKPLATWLQLAAGFHRAHPPPQLPPRQYRR